MPIGSVEIVGSTTRERFQENHLHATLAKTSITVVRSDVDDTSAVVAGQWILFASNPCYLSLAHSAISIEEFIARNLKMKLA
ncbi:hypothetical protein Moror_11179 [Moniliophthora roreri MCA 2997]|uniref:Uncharacterized protein n=1 Tax=Moniliophthora roreri (strain MCA 2997) TaxID=1381753 RepID=V2WQ85_MONRO|nr:hypothetical protein Moror_11179 [Moniliophthora roreri MCA 2997]